MISCHRWKFPRKQILIDNIETKLSLSTGLAKVTGVSAGWICKWRGQKYLRCLRQWHKANFQESLSRKSTIPTNIRDHSPPEFKATLLGMCPNTEFLLVQIQENTDQNKLCICKLLTHCNLPIYYEVSQYTAENIGGYSKAVVRRKIVHTEFFLVCIFLYLNWIRRFTPQISVFTRNAGKYKPEKLSIWTIFM